MASSQRFKAGDVLYRYGPAADPFLQSYVSREHELIWSLAGPNAWVSFQTLEEEKKNYLGANRIHKPFILIFYTDIKNGKAGEAKKIVLTDEQARSFSELKVL